MSSETFARIKREEPLSHRVERQIREAIKAKIFVPGDKLPGELELAEQFGVSRTAIREALRMLVGRGLINIRKGSGIYISEINMENVVDPFYQLLDMKCGEGGYIHLIRVRLMMEPDIAKSAAENRTDEDVSYLRGNFADMESHAEDPEEMRMIDMKFHRRLAKATGNPLIPTMMEPIYQLLPKFIASNNERQYARERAVENHRGILRHIEMQNAEGAFQVMRNHMEEAEKFVLEYYERVGFTNF